VQVGNNLLDSGGHLQRDFTLGDWGDMGLHAPFRKILDSRQGLTPSLPNPLIINALWGPARKCLNINRLQQLYLYHKLVRVSSIFFLEALKKLSKKPCAGMNSLIIFMQLVKQTKQKQNKEKHMAQLAKQSSSFNYSVEAAPSFMQLTDGSFVKDGFTVNRRTDTLEVLGKVTDRYGIVQNADLIQVAEDAFAAKKMTDYTRKVVVTGAGEKVYAVYDFKNHTKKLKVGDEVGLRLTLQNSFDGSLRASFGLGMLRLLCLNGMTTMEREVGMTKKHSSGINVQFVSDALEKAIVSWNSATAVFDRLSDVKVTQIQGANILANLEKQSVISGKLREGIGGIWASPTHREDAGRNLFNLYNAVTQHLTHDVAGDRFELANRVSANVLAAFDRASQKSDRFARLVTPVQQDLVAVSLN
jgi:hypothetical protein